MIRRRAFTLVELLTVVAVIALLISIAMPSMMSAVEMGRAARCRANVRQFGLALTAYTGANDDCFPRSSCHEGQHTDRWWLTLLRPYSARGVMFRCPSDTAGGFLDWEDPPPRSQWRKYRWSSYVSNAWMDGDYNNVFTVTSPRHTIYAAEAAESLLGVDHVHPEMWRLQQQVLNNIDATRHNGRAHYLFADGHGDSLTFEQTWHTGRVNLWHPGHAPDWWSALPAFPPR